MNQRLYVLNELTIICFVLNAIFGRRPIYIRTQSYIYFLSGILHSLATKLCRMKWATTLKALSLANPDYPNFPFEKNLTTHIFPKVSSAIRDVYALQPTSSRLDAYRYPIAKSVTDYTEGMCDLVLLMEWISENSDTFIWHLYGFPRDAHNIYQVYTGRQWPERKRNSATLVFALLNAINAGMACIASLIWLVCCVRLKPRPEKTFRIAVDRISPDDAYTFNQIIDDKRELLIVDRNRNLADRFAPSNDGFESCLKEDAQIPVSKFLNLFRNVVIDLFLMCRKIGGWDPRLFGMISILVAKRYMFAAFFSSYNVGYFFGRDDYSRDHILRNQELRKIGGTAMGINHGLPLNTITPAWQEVDFDIYYAFGSHLYENVHIKTWPETCQVKAVGTKNMKREYRDQLSKPRSKDIAFFPIVSGQFEAYMREVYKIANHFSDRYVFIKMKPGRSAEFMNKYRGLLRDAPLNVVVYIHPNPYELLLQVQYSLAFTTLVAESLQFKNVTFTFDNDPSITDLYYRNFPNLLVTNAADVIKRIENIEAGTEQYNFEQYNTLIRINGPDIFDTIRADIATN